MHEDNFRILVFPLKLAMSWMERSSSGRFGPGRMRMIGYPTAWLSSSCICLECQYVVSVDVLPSWSAHTSQASAYAPAPRFFLWPQRGMPGVPQRTVNESKCNGFGAWLQLLPQAAPEWQEMEIVGVGGSVAFSPMSEQIVASAFITKLLLRRPSCTQRPWYMLPVDMHDDWVHVLHLSW